MALILCSELFQPIEPFYHLIAEEPILEWDRWYTYRIVYFPSSGIISVEIRNSKYKSHHMWIGYGYLSPWGSNNVQQERLYELIFSNNENLRVPVVQLIKAMEEYGDTQHMKDWN